ncbi:MAG: thiamine pyrophosphate-binding protein [Desulfomicrobium escambiense]|nr:thiamine pyrophosphate-binding protein [Desulfomicrobium escambiense]
MPLYQALYERRDADPPTSWPATSARPASWPTSTPGSPTSPGCANARPGPARSIPHRGSPRPTPPPIPILLFTSGVSLAGEGKGTITEMDHHVFFESISKWSNFLKLAVKIPETLRRAFRVATSGCPGAVHLAFPTETVTDRIPLERGFAARRSRSAPTYPSMRFRGSPDAITRVARQPAAGPAPGADRRRRRQPLPGPRRGPGAGRAHPGPGGHHHLRPGHHAGPARAGARGDRRQRLPPARRSGPWRKRDVLLYVGCKMGSVSTVRWTLPCHASRGGTSCRSTSTRASSATTFPVDEAVVGRCEARARGRSGRAGTGSAPTRMEAGSEDLNRDRRHFWDQAAAVLASEETPLVAAAGDRVARTASLREPAVVIADAGTATPYVTRYLKLNHEPLALHHPQGLRRPRLRHPGRRRARGWRGRRPGRSAFSATAAWAMSCGELETLVRYEVPAVLIHFNNGSFGWIKTLQKIHSREPLSVRRLHAARHVRASPRRSACSRSARKPRPSWKTASRQALCRRRALPHRRAQPPDRGPHPAGLLLAEAKAAWTRSAKTRIRAIVGMAVLFSIGIPVWERHLAAITLGPGRLSYT